MLLVPLAACSPGGKRPAEKPAPPAKSAKPGDSREAIARLGGAPVYVEDVSANVAFQIYSLRTDIFTILKRETEEYEDREVLAREAAKQGIGVEDLLRKNVDEKVAPVTDAEVDKYLKEHPQYAAAGAEARPRAKFYLSETGKIDKKLAYLADLRAKAGYEFLMKPPEEPRTRVATEGAPSRGPEGAPITLVHFATFSSTYSAASNGYIQRLEKEFPGKFRVVFLNFINPYDETGLLCAEVAVTAQAGGKFWELHDRLFALEGKIDEKALRRAVEEIGLDPAIVDRVKSDPATLVRLKKDLDAGFRAGVKREPVLFVNGRYFSGTFPYDKLRGIVLAELNAPPAAETGAR
jgi:hypothetical protein